MTLFAPGEMAKRRLEYRGAGGRRLRGWKPLSQWCAIELTIGAKSGSSDVLSAPDICKTVLERLPYIAAML